MSSPKTTVLIFGDQLNTAIGALATAKPKSHRVLMVESTSKVAARKWHIQRIHLIVASMRRFADELREIGYDGALTMEAVAPVDRTPASPWPDQVERNPVDISPEQLKFIQDHGSSLLSESFYTRLFETAAGTLLPLIR